MTNNSYSMPSTDAAHHGEFDDEARERDRGQNHTTRNVTVAIQYTFLNDNRNPQGSVTEDSRSTPANDTQSQSNNGSMFFSFPDIPEPNSRERFNEIMALAADMAMNRLTRRMRPLRGLSNEAFDALPVKKLKSVTTDTCSICYDKFEEEYEESERKWRHEGLTKSAVGSRLVDGDRKQNDHAFKIASFGPEEGSSAGRPWQDTAYTPKNLSEEPKKEHTPTYKHSPTELKCGHVFGRVCIYQWTKENNSCPICRAKIVGREGLVQRSPDDQGNDMIFFDRIRDLLYGPQVSANTRIPGEVDGMAIAQGPIGMETEDEPIFPSHNTGVSGEGIPREYGIQDRAASGISPMRRSPTMAPLPLLDPVDTNYPLRDAFNDTGEPYYNTGIDFSTQNFQHTNRVAGVLDHVFNTSNESRPRVIPQPVFGIGPPNHEQNSRRRPIFRNFGRALRNLRNPYIDRTDGFRIPPQTRASHNSTFTSRYTPPAVRNSPGNAAANTRNCTTLPVTNNRGGPSPISSRNQPVYENSNGQNFRSPHFSNLAQDNSNS